MSSPQPSALPDDYADYLAWRNQRHHPLVRVDSYSTVSSNATASNQEGPGRTVGLLLDRFAAGLETVIANSVLDPKHVAGEIRRVCRHEEVSFIDRLKASNRLSDIEQTTLRKLCKKILKFVRHHLRVWNLTSLDLIVDLSIEDPLVRLTFRAMLDKNEKYLQPKYYEPDLFLGAAKARSCIYEDRVHNVWSDAILGRFAGYSGQLVGEREIDSHLCMLSTSLRHPESALVAARYLTNFARFSREAAGPRFHNIVKSLSKDYLEITIANPSGVEWRNVHDLIYAADEFDELGRFLVRLAPKLMEHNIAKSLMNKFFATSKLCDASLVDLQPQRDLLPWHNRLTFLCLCFLEHLTGSRRIKAHITHTVPILEFVGADNVFGHDELIAHCHIASAAQLFLQRRKMTGNNLESLRVGSEVIISRLHSTSHLYKPVLSLVTQISWSNRYFKHALADIYLNAINIEDFAANIPEIMPSWLETESDDELFWLTDGRPRFLTRIRSCEISSPIILTVDPDDMSQRMLRRCISEAGVNLHVDAMVINRGTTMLLCIEEGDVFCVDEHYPVLAGFDQLGDPLYLALMDKNSHRFITCIKDGAHSATFNLPNGDIRIVQQFHVLVLRYDPIDLTFRKSSRHTHHLAMDPTGPLFWIPLWQTRDRPFVGDVDELIIRNHLACLYEALQASSLTNDGDILVRDSRGESKHVCLGKWVHAREENQTLSPLSYTNNVEEQALALPSSDLQKQNADKRSGSNQTKYQSQSHILLNNFETSKTLVATAIESLGFEGSFAARLNGYLELQEILNSLQSVIGHVLFEVNIRSLDFLMGTTNGKPAFDSLMEKQGVISSNLCHVDCKALRELAGTWDGNVVITPLIQSFKAIYNEFSVECKAFRDLYLPCEFLVDSFDRKPFHVMYPLVHAPSKEDDDALKCIICIGQTLQPVAIGLGTQWITKTISENPTISDLREIQVEVLQRINAFFEDSNLKLAPPIDLQESIKKELERVRSQRFRVVFCGMVKAGKSTFLNALVGQQVLPSDEMPATAWPCRVRHDPCAQIPILSIEPKCFEKSLADLRKLGIGLAMENFNSSLDHAMARADDENDSDSDFDDDITSSSTGGNAPCGPRLEDRNDDETKLFFREWKDLYQSTKTNLKEFEEPSYRLPDYAEGNEAVVNLLGKVNDLIRLCRVFNVATPEADPDAWPSLRVQFRSLKDVAVEGLFEFIDLPGLGESRSCTSDFHTFEDLVRAAARKADTIVPIISFKEASKVDWRKQLPGVVENGLKRPPDFVLCTHLDHVQTPSRIQDYVTSVGKAFWSINTVSEFDRKILRCSSRLGFGAQTLLAQSKTEKPDFCCVWEGDKTNRDCAESILGLGNPKGKYGKMEHETWLKALEEQYEESCLGDALSQLTAGIVNSMQGRALQVEGKKLLRMMQKLISEQSRQLLEMSRSRDEFTKAYQKFQQAREQFEAIQRNCEEESIKLKNSSAVQLDRALAILEQDGQQSVTRAVKSSVNNSGARPVHSESLATHWHELGPGEAKPNELIFDSKYELEDFYFMVQKALALDVKNNLMRKFISFVRSLASGLRRKLFEFLKENLRAAAMENQAPSELAEDVLDKIAFDFHNIEALLSVNLKHNVVRSKAERHSIATAYSSIKQTMSKPFCHTREQIIRKDDLEPDIQSLLMLQRSPAPELGLMIRAPIAVLATIPLVLGSFMWPLMTHKKRFVVDKERLVKLFQKQVLEPYFSEVEKEAGRTLEACITRSLQQVKDTMKNSLQEEQARFDREISLKELAVQETIPLAADIVSSYWNLLAAVECMNELQVKFREVLQ